MSSPATVGTRLSGVIRSRHTPPLVAGIDRLDAVGEIGWRDDGAIGQPGRQGRASRGGASQDVPKGFGGEGLSLIDELQRHLGEQ